MKNSILKSILMLALFNVSLFVSAQETKEEELSPIRTRNLWYGSTQNAQGLQKGEGILGTNGILTPQIRYGATDNFSLGFSTSLNYVVYPILTSNYTSYILPLNINTEFNKSIRPNFHVALGADIAVVLSKKNKDFSTYNGSQTYVSTTIGNYKNSLTLKGGCNVHLLINELENMDDGFWFGSVATKIKVGKCVDFIGELRVDTYDTRYLLTWSKDDTYENEISYGGNLGFRFYVKEKLSFDVGFNEFTVSSMAFVGVPVPYLNVAIPLFNE